MRIIVTKKGKLRIIESLSVIILLTFIIIAGTEKKKENMPVMSSSPISCFESSTPIYTVIGVADKETTVKNLILFAEICNGFGVKPAVFAENDQIKRIIGVFSQIDGFECDYGIICENTEGMSRSEFLKYLALQNDEFYLTVGKHALCCYINGTNSLYSSDVMASYGQYGIRYSICAGNNDAAVKKGDIAAVMLSDETSVYELVSLITQGSSDGLKAVPIKEYIAEYESFTES